MDFEAGLARARQRERNNRKTARAKGMAAKVPVKSGATSGFGSNALRNGKIGMSKPGRKVG